MSNSQTKAKGACFTQIAELGAFGAQQLSNGVVSVSQRVVQRRVAKAIHSVDLSVVLDQQLRVQCI